MSENKKSENIIISIEIKKQIKDLLYKILGNTAHKIYFEKNEKPTPFVDVVEKDITIGIPGLVSIDKLIQALLKIKEIKNNCSIPSLYFILTRVLNNIYENQKVSSEQLKEKVLLEFTEEDIIEKEIEDIEKILNDGIKKWNILSPLQSIQLKDINELFFGKCRIFVMDKVRKEKLQGTRPDKFSLIPFLGEELTFFEGSVYIETTLTGYHGNRFETSKVVRETNENFSKCLAVLKIITRLFEIKGKPWLSFARPFYWIYLYEEGKESSGQTINAGETLHFSNENYTISKDHIEKFRASYPYENLNKLLLTKGVNEVERRILRALEWFNSGFSEENDSHKYIQYCIALESLLSYSDVFTVSSNEIAERVAFLWTKETSKRIMIKKDFKKNIFRIRARLLHGGFSLREEDYGYLKKLEKAIIISVIKITSEIDNLKTNEDLTKYFDWERFYPQPDPEFLKELAETAKKIKE